MVDDPILLLLAGGRSSRMGHPKGLLRHANRFWIEHQLDAYDGMAVVGLGYHETAYRHACPWMPVWRDGTQQKVSCVVNPHPKHGPFSTLHQLLSSVGAAASSFFVQPIDVPMVSPASQKALMGAGGDISIPCFEGRGGHPVWISNVFARHLLTMSPSTSRLDHCIRAWQADRVHRLTVPDQCCVRNINTIEEWQGYLSRHD